MFAGISIFFAILAYVIVEFIVAPYGYEDETGFHLNQDKE